MAEASLKREEPGKDLGHLTQVYKGSKRKRENKHNYDGQSEEAQETEASPAYGSIWIIRREAIRPQ